MNNVYSQQSSPGIVNLNLGIENYEKGKYENAILSLDLAVTQLPVDDKENLWKAHFHLALSHYLMGEEEGARKELKNALEISEKHPDPEIYSPRIVKLFNKIKEEEKEMTVKVTTKPFYKKWWFWAIIAGVGIGAAAGGGGGGSSSGGGGGDESDTGSISGSW